MYSKSMSETPTAACGGSKANGTTLNEEPSKNPIVTFPDEASMFAATTTLPDEVDDNYETWQLFTPDGLVLNYGPGDHWRLKKASDPV
jgi:hypothetical protein